MRKVIIKPWFMMKREFGLDSLGNIDCKNVFTKKMEENIPDHRIIDIPEDMFWDSESRDWIMSEDMILGDFIPIGTKGIAWDDDKDCAEECWFEGYGLDNSGFKCNVIFANANSNAYKNFKPLTEEPEVKEPTQEEINKVLDYLRKENK